MRRIFGFGSTMMKATLHHGRAEKIGPGCGRGEERDGPAASRVVMMIMMYEQRR